jgi:uncharacterized membrane protein
MEEVAGQGQRHTNAAHHLSQIDAMYGLCAGSVRVSGPRAAWGKQQDPASDSTS